MFVKKLKTLLNVLIFLSNESNFFKVAILLSSVSQLSSQSIIQKRVLHLH